MRKRLAGCAALCMAVIIAATTAMPSMAASWQQDSKGWRYQKDDGSYHTGSWQWLEGNKDGKDECYYFGSDGYMASNGKTPDGYDVNADGQWTVNGVVQTKAQNQAQNQTQNQSQAGIVVVPEGSWVQGTGDKNFWRKWWKNADGTYPVNEWVWLDDDGDGTAECYSFDSEGWLKSSGLTSDGYIVNIDGQWTVNGIVQTRKTAAAGTGTAGPGGVGSTSTGRSGSGSGGSSGGGGGSSSGGNGSSSHSSYEKANDFTYGNYGMMSSSERKAVEDAIEKFKDEYDIDSLNDFEKEIKIIGWLVENCSYKAVIGTWDYATAYSCIVKHQAQCSGYADAFLQVAKACGLDVRYVDNDYHAWNAIKLDGEWYHVDVTWDDTGAVSARLPKGEANVGNKYINLTDEQILACDEGDSRQCHRKWHNSSIIKATSTKYGPHSVAYYLLTGDARAVTDDEVRLYCMDNNYPIGHYGGGNLTELGYKLDSGENYFEDPKNQIEEVIAYLRSRFDQKKDAYITVPTGYDMTWLTRGWVNDALNTNSKDYQNDRSKVGYDEFLIWDNNITSYQISYPEGYRTLDQIAEIEEEVRELWEIQDGPAATVERIRELSNEHFAKFDTSYKLLLTEERTAGVKDHATATARDIGCTYDSDIIHVIVDGEKYAIETHTVTYIPRKEWAQKNFRYFLMENEVNVFDKTFETNVEGVSFADVYADMISDATASMKLPVIYAEDLDMDELKEQVIAAFEAAGQPIIESSFTLDKHLNYGTVGLKRYEAGYVCFNLAISCDEAMELIDDQYKTDGDGNLFVLSDRDVTAQEVASYLGERAEESEEKAKVYFILAAPERNPNISWLIKSEFRKSDAAENYKADISDYAAYRQQYADGYLLVFEVYLTPLTTKKANAAGLTNTLQNSANLGNVTLTQETAQTAESTVSSETQGTETSVNAASEATAEAASEPSEMQTETAAGTTGAQPEGTTESTAEVQPESTTEGTEETQSESTAEAQPETTAESASDSETEDVVESTSEVREDSTGAVGSEDAQEIQTEAATPDSESDVAGSEDAASEQEETTASPEGQETTASAEELEPETLLEELETETSPEEPEAPRGEDPETEAAENPDEADEGGNVADADGEIDEVDSELDEANDKAYGELDTAECEADETESEVNEAASEVSEAGSEVQ